ncbi:MAG: hypothetical protein AAGD11_18685, partial [Planctomycetota bacterium]
MPRKRKKSRSRRRTKAQSAGRRNRLQFAQLEQLEERLLLAITTTYDESNHVVSIDANDGETIHFRTAGGFVEMSTDGTNFSTDLDLEAAGVQSQSIFDADLTSFEIDAVDTNDDNAQLLTTDLSQVRLGDMWLPGADLIVNGRDIRLEDGVTVSTANNTPQIEDGGLLLFNGDMLSAGNEVRYAHNGDALVGLDSNSTYFVIKDPSNPNRIELEESPGSGAIDLSTTATTGDTHQFVRVGFTEPLTIAGDLIINQKDGSGNLSYDAESVNTGVGSKVLADSEGVSETPGDVLLTVFDSDFDGLVNSGSPKAELTLTDATVRGAQVEITSFAEDIGSFGTGDIPILGPFLEQFIGSISVLGGGTEAFADAIITISGGSIDAADNVVLDAGARTTANVNVITAFIGVAGAQTRVNADVNITDQATIQAGGNVDIATFSDSEASISAARQTSITGGVVSLYKEPVNIAVAVFVSDIDSTATLDAGTSVVAGGAVTVDAGAIKQHSVSTSTAAGQKGSVGTSISVTVGDTNVDALVDGDVQAVGNITVTADIDVPINETLSSAVVGESAIVAAYKDFKKGAKQSIVNGLKGLIKDKNFQGFKNFGEGREEFEGKFGFSLATSWAVHDNFAEARIGAGAEVTSTTGDITVRSTIVDKPQLYAFSDVESDATAKNTRDNAVAAGLTVGLFSNDADALIGSGAQVNVPQGDLSVSTDTSIPWEQQWWKWDGITSITDKISLNFGIQAGLFTSWAETYVSGKKRAFGGAVNYMSFDNHSDAIIAPSADINVGGDVSVIALNENDTLNFGGQFLFSLPVPGLGLAGSTSGGSGVGGSVVVVDYENHVNAKIKADVELDAGSLLVMATTDERNISLTTQGGTADEFAFNGAASALLVDNTTTAQIDDEAKITVGTGFVDVPRDFDTVPIDSNTLFSDLPQFNPSEAFAADDQGGDILRVNVENDVISLPYDHGLETGQGVRYTNGGGTDIGGLSNEGFYFVIKVDDSKIQLASTLANALAGTELPLNLNTTAGFAHTLYPSFNPSEAVDGGDNTLLDLGYDHGLQSGQQVTYYNGSAANQDIGGLADDATYSILVVDETKVRLFDVNVSVLPIELNETTSSGADHYLIPQPGEITVENPLNSLDSDGDGDVDTNDDHIALVSDDVYVTDLSLLVLADDNAGLYSGTGGFTLGRNIGAGVSVSVSDIRRDTEAFIGNVSESLGLPGTTISPGVGVDSLGEFYLGYNHGLSEGDRVTYSSGGDYVIEGLYDAGVYFVSLTTDSDSSGDPKLRLGRTLVEAQLDASTLFDPSDVTDSLGDDFIDLGYAHGFQLGDAVFYDPGTGGTAIGGLTAGDDIYYVVPIDSTTIALTLTLSDALRRYDLVFEPSDTLVDGLFTFGFEHGFEDGQPVLYTAGGGTAISGLTDGEVYLVDLDGGDSFSFGLINTDGSDLTIDPSNTSDLRHTFQRGFAPSSANVDSTEDVIDAGFFHAFNHAQAVQYFAPGGNAINGLTDGDVYYVVLDGENSFALADTAATAEAAVWRFFEPDTHFIDSQTIDFGTTHEFQSGDELIYTSSEFFADPSAANTTPLKYLAADGVTEIALTEGQSLFAIRIDGDFLVFEEDNSSNTGSTELQLSLTPGGDPLTFVATGTDESVHGFRSTTGRIAISANATEDPGHFFVPYVRADLDASVATGTNHSLRTAIDSSTGLKNTHGLGRLIDPSSAVSDDTISLTAHGFETGDAVVYSNGRGTSIGGIGHGNVYYVIKSDADSFQLAESAEEALSASPEIIGLDGDEATGSSHGFGRAIRPSALVDSELNTINFGFAHSFDSDDIVVYDSGDGTDIGGLETGTSYRVVVVNSTTIKLENVSTGQEVPLDGTLGTGADHTFSEPTGTGFVSSAGDAVIIANNDGEIISISLAAAVATPSKSGAVASGQTEASDSTDNATSAKPKHGISIAGDVTVGIISDTTLAFIDDADFTATSLVVRAINDSVIGSGSGAIAVSTSTDDSKGIAGSFTTNVIDNETKAYIEDSQVTIIDGELDIDADSSAEVTSVGMGGAGVSGSLAIAGSVVVNVITNTTQAKIVDSEVDVTSSSGTQGDVSVNATDTSQIIAIAGAGAVASGFSTKTQRGIGAAIVVNVIANSDGNVAEIVDSDVVADGTIVVDAMSDVQVDSVAAAVALAGGLFSIGKAQAAAISIGVNVVSANTKASISRKKNNGIAGSQGVDVSADDNTDIVSVAGTAAIALGASGSDAAGAAIAVNVVNNAVKSFITETTVSSNSGDVIVEAESTPTISSVAAGAAVSGATALQGSFSINVVDNETQAYIDGTTTNISAAGSVLVAADDRLDLVTVGGSFALGGFTGGNSVGVANSTVVTDNLVEAYIGDGVSVQANADTNIPALNVRTGEINDDLDKQTESSRGVMVTAVSLDEVISVAIGGSVGGASGSAIAGSATVTSLSEDTRAYVGASAQINQADSTNESTSQSVLVRAGERTELTGIAGAAAGSFSESGIGAGIDVAVINKNVEAWIDSGADVDARKDVFVEATSLEDVLSVAASAAAGQSSGIAGAVGVSIYDITTRAEIEGADVGAGLSGASVLAEGNVLVAAEERTELEIGGGSLAFGASNGVGGAIEVPIFTKSTTATIGNGAIVDAWGTRDAMTVNSGDFVAFGGDSQSGAIQDVPLDATDLPTDEDRGYFEDRNATPDTIIGFKGVAVTAVNSDQVELYSLGAAGSTGSFAVQVSIGLNVIDEDTFAKVGDNAQINQNADNVNAGTDQSVLVTAGNDFFTRSIVGGISGSANIAATPGAEVAIVTMNTQASIGADADVDATQDVIVSAYNEEDVETVAISLSGAVGAFAGAGAASVVDINNTTKAFIADELTTDAGAEIDAGGNVRVHAEDRTDADVIAGGVGGSGSGGGVGVSIGVALISKDTEAYIGQGATVTADGAGTSSFAVLNGDDNSGTADTTDILGVGVTAVSTEDIFNLGVAGAGGLVAGVAGSVTWQQIDSDTTAYIAADSTITTNQEVYVTAVNTVRSFGIAGALAGGVAAGIGAGLDVGTVANSTQAFIAGNVIAVEDVRVAATSERDISSIAVAGSLGFASLSGGISFWSIGGNVDGSYDVGGANADALRGSEGDSATTETQDTLDDSTDEDLSYSDSGNSNRGDNSSMVSTETVTALDDLDSFSDFIVSGLVSETRAYIAEDAEVTTDGDLEVVAREDTNASLVGGALSVGVVGIGAGVTILNIASTTEAFINDGARATVAGGVRVRSSAKEKAAVNAITGAVGAFGFAGAAAYAEIDSTGRRAAYIGFDADQQNEPGAEIIGATEIIVSASHDRELDATSGGGSVGGIAAGASGAQVDAGGSTEAFIGSDALLGEFDDDGEVVGTVGSLTVTANGVDNISANAVAVSGGTVALVGVSGQAIVDPTVQVAVGREARIYAEDAIDLIAQTDQISEADAFGLQVGGLAVGSSRSVATIGSDVSATVGDDVELSASSISIDAIHNLTNTGANYTGAARQADAEATASGGAAVAILGAEATANAAGSVEIIVGDDAQLTATSDDISIRSLSYNDADSDGSGVAVGFVGVGRDVGDANLITRNSVIIGDHTQIISNDGDVTLLANSSDKADADATAGDAGLATNSEARTNVNADQITSVAVDDGARIEADGTLSIQATMASETDSNATADNSIDVALISTVVSEATTTYDNSQAVTDIGAANLVADRVEVGAEVSSIDASSVARSDQAFSLGLDTLFGDDLGADSTANTDVTTVAEVKVAS